MAKRPAQVDPIDPTGEFPFDAAGYFLHLTVVIDRHRDLRVEALLRPLGVSIAGHRALRIIHNRGSVTMGELADYAIIDRTTLTRLVDHLVDAGYVERSKPAGDRRKIVLTMTKAGAKAQARMRRLIRKDNLELTRDLPEADLRIAARLQRRIVTRLVEDEQLAQRLLWGRG